MGAGSIEEAEGTEEVTVRKMTISQSSKAAQEWTGSGVSLRRGAAARGRQRSGFGGLIRGVGAGMLAAVGVLALAAPAWAQSCADCHSGIGPASHTAHAAVACDSCHLNHEEFPHPAEASNVACAVCHSPEADQTALGVHAQHQPETEAADCTVCHGTAHEVALPGTTPFRRAMVETCGMCHSEELEQFQQSVHGKLLNTVGGREAPNCTTCHDEHAIRHPSDPKARTHGSHIRETCSACHADLALTSRFGMAGNRVLSFDASYHGLAARAGSQTVANCGSCHGYHDILPSTDPRSRIYPANLFIAVLTVITSRVFVLTPGIVFGTPGGIDINLSERQRGRQVVLAFAALVATTILGGVGWAASGAVQISLNQPIDTRVADLAIGLLNAAQDTSLAVFLIAMETLFFEMLPLAYGLGQTFFQWNKIAWGVLFAPIAFLFSHTLLNPNSGFLESFQASNVRFLWFVLFVLVGITAALWAYFNVLRDMLNKPPAPPRAAPPRNPPQPPYRG